MTVGTNQTTRSLLYNLANGSMTALADDAAIALNKTLALNLQSRLQNFWLLDKPDGLWGAKSARALAAYKRFRRINEPGIGKLTATSLINTNPVDLIPGFRLNGDWASRTVMYMTYYNQFISRNGSTGEINIVYFRGLDRAGQRNTNAPFVFNDRRCVLVVKNEIPSFAGNWLATTEPGRTYWKRPMNPKGCAVLRTGQAQAWVVGAHITQSSYQSPSLVQDDVLTVLRGGNQVQDRGLFGINQHTVADADQGDPDFTPGDEIGWWSAGCLVGASSREHYEEFMPLVQADPREKATPGKYKHWTSVINGSEFLDLFPA